MTRVTVDDMTRVTVDDMTRVTVTHISIPGFCTQSNN